jgi:hypothetical protein
MRANEGVDNELIPVDTWAAFAEKGGIKGVMDFLPIDMVIVVVEKLFNIRQQLIQDIYQIMGISDIVRGATNPNETLGAQKIKAQFASVRLDALKFDLARFVSEIVQLTRRSSRSRRSCTARTGRRRSPTRKPRWPRARARLI